MTSCTIEQTVFGSRPLDASARPTPRRDDRIVVSVQGDLDAAELPAFQRKLESAMATRPGRVTVDLTATHFLSIGAAEYLASAKRHAHDIHLPLDLDPGPRAVEHALEVTGVASIFGR